MSWQQLHLQCAKGHTELAETLLLEAGAISISLTDAGDQPLFEPMPNESPLWDEVIVTALFDSSTFASASELETLSHTIADSCHASRVWVSQLADKDWTREWMQHYQPIECAHGLWIVPQWLDAPDPSATNLYLDPGLAFGTGYHATTRLCLDWLAGQDLTDKIVIDYGCGSGILGVAALVLGAKVVYAVDIDPQAVLASQQNARLNGVQDRLQTFLPEAFATFWQEADMQADMITANILAKPLIQLAPYFATLLKPHGSIVLAGLIENQVEAVREAYAPFFDIRADFTFKNEEDEHWHRLSGVRRIN